MIADIMSPSHLFLWEYCTYVLLHVYLILNIVPKICYSLSICYLSHNLLRYNLSSLSNILTLILKHFLSFFFFMLNFLCVQRLDGCAWEHWHFTFSQSLHRLNWSPPSCSCYLASMKDFTWNGGIARWILPSWISTASSAGHLLINSHGQVSV